MLQEEVKKALGDLLKAMPLNSRHVLVVGASTSEVAGEKIGTSGSEEIAKLLYDGICDVQRQTGFHLAFQTCEHLNRALVVERQTAEKFGWPEVMVVPVHNAGGAMAAYAFRHMQDPVIVEQIQADAGIDIGDTLIGMHLKPVAVPVRSTQRTIGKAHVTMAKTRPKLIGGARAIYERKI
ncbi:MAG: TIGR01440 family protein [Thermoactinomyces sp.]